jgi:hypothetical protein
MGDVQPFREVPFLIAITIIALALMVFGALLRYAFG